LNKPTSLQYLLHQSPPIISSVKSTDIDIVPVSQSVTMTMISTTSRHAIRRVLASSNGSGTRNFVSSGSRKASVSAPASSSSGLTTGSRYHFHHNHHGGNHTHRAAAVGAIASVVAVGAAAVIVEDRENPNTRTTYISQMAARIPTSGDVLSVGKITKEPATGLAFPELCNGMTLAGVGVRIKYVFVKVRKGSKRRQSSTSKYPGPSGLVII
jgi:hypothetical protein